MEDLINDNDLKNIDLLKLDCEGAEYDILMKSSEQTFQKIKEIRMEFHKDIIDKEVGIKELSTFLGVNGFVSKKLINKSSSSTGYVVFKKIN